MTSTDRNPPHPHHALVFRAAQRRDGAALWHLVRDTRALELNSAYFYVLFATDFGQTCLVAEAPDGRLAGLVIGYLPPTQADTAFVWQVGVHPDFQGQGLGLQLLQQWWALPALSACRWLTATVADGNTASRALFERFARAHGRPCERRPHFTADLFPIDHPAEPLLRIGPIDCGRPAPV